MNKRKLVWARRTRSVALPAASTGDLDDVLIPFRAMMGITANLPGTTVSRCRLDIFAATMGAGTFPFQIGLRTVNLRDVTEAGTDPAYALNISPGVEIGADWMYWRSFFPNHGSDPTTGVPNAATYEVDVKSMRRLDEPQETLGLFISKPLSTAGVTINTSISVLLALP